MKHLIRARALLIFGLAAVSGAMTASAQSGYTFTTMAGSQSGDPGFLQGIATEARFTSPTAVSSDSLGNIFVVEAQASTIRKITPARAVTAITLDGGTLSNASGILADPSGNFYIADTGNHRILKVTPSGTVEVFAGTAGTPGSTEGTGTAATFYHPVALTRDASGNLYVADAGSGWIRRVSLSRVVENWVSGFNLPRGLGIDTAGNIYVAEENNHVIKKVTPSKVVSTIAGTTSGWADGDASVAKFKNPRGVVVDSSGNLFVTDTGNHVIRQITIVGGETTVATIAGIPGTSGKPNNSAGTAFNQPYGIALDSAGNIYIADYSNHAIRWGATSAPTLASSTSVSATVGQTFSYTVSFTASMRGSYVVSGLPTGLTYNAATAIISGTPTTATLAEPHAVTLTAMNGAGTTGSTLNLTIGKGSQSITFGTLADKTYGDAPFALSATASSGLTVNFAVVSGPATVSGNTVTLTGAGTVVIRASQPGNANYNAAPEVDRTFTVAPTFASWQLSKFTAAELENPSLSGPTAVYGLDGLSNLVKYALGLEPKVNVTSGLPDVTVNESDWIFTYTRPSNTTDLTYTVEASTNLTSWSTSGVTHEMVSNGGSQVWRGRYPLTAPKVFFRLSVTGATSSTTPPVGGMSATINAGSVIAPVSTSFVIPLFDTPLATGAGAGRISALSSTTITSTSAGWNSGALATLTFPYAFQITSGSAAGAIFRITGNTADSIATSGVDLTTLGISAGPAGDSFRLIPLDTLNTLFGASTLLGGASPTDADTVILSSASQISYYYNTSLSRWVRTTGPTTDRGNIAIPFESTVTIVRKSSALTLRFTGQVPTSRFWLAVPNAGATYTHTGFPTDVTLGALTLQTALPGWTSSSAASTADTLTVGIGAAALTYFHNGTNWIRSTGPTTNRDAINVPAGTPIIIFKRGSSPGTSVLTRHLPYSP